METEATTWSEFPKGGKNHCRTYTSIRRKINPKGKSMETETTTWSEFPKGGKNHCRTYTSIRRKINLKEQNCESHNQGSK